MPNIILIKIAELEIVRKKLEISLIYKVLTEPSNITKQ